VAKLIHPMNGVLAARSAPESLAESTDSTAFSGTNPTEMPLLMRQSTFTTDC